MNGGSDKITIGSAKVIVRTLNLSGKLAHEIFLLNKSYKCDAKKKESEQT